MLEGAPAADIPGLHVEHATGLRPDQASGLRRLFARPRLRVLPVGAGRRGVGKTTVVAGLASALTAVGHRVLVLDQTAGELGEALGVTARHDLGDLLEGSIGVAEILEGGRDGIGLLGASRSLAQCAGEGADGGRLFGAIASGRGAPDIVILNLGARDSAAMRLVPRDREILLVTRSMQSAVTATYAQVKECVRHHGHRRFRLLVCGADLDAGRSLHRHMAGVARRFLDADLAFAGVLPADAALRAGGASAALCSNLLFSSLAASLAGWRLAEYPIT